jgi:flagellar hook-associated protein 3 FlgL
MLENTESVIDSMVTQLQRVNTLVIQGASDSYTAEDKISISYEINQILEEVVTEANTKTESAYIFAGTNTNTQPYTVERDEQGEIISVTTNGTSGDLNRAIGENIQIKANINGEELFERDVNLFNLLISIRDDLRANNSTELRESLNDLSDAQEKVYNIQAVIGARVNRVESAATRAESDVVNFTQFLSDAVDIDAAEAIVDYQVELQILQSALQAGARLFQQSLIDFLA